MASLVMLSAAALLGLLLPSSMADNVLYGGDNLCSNESLTEGEYTFIMQDDCKLVLCDNGQEVWTSATNVGTYNCFARMQTDGNLVMFNDEFNKVWESRTQGPEGNYILVLQRDGHVIIYDRPIWTISADEPTNKKITVVKPTKP